jgi:hypothetical protein
MKDRGSKSGMVATPVKRSDIRTPQTSVAGGRTLPARGREDGAVSSLSIQ